ncbi:acetate--CoA ligase [Janibacter alittae]|uniref:Acetate--CoA ligase n=1 Tax=Janibacter alittae TaxID=3115209 RepID=A0ABZ2MFQ1_9MICO
MSDYAPSTKFADQAVGKAALYDEAAADHEGFWAARAREYVTWSKDFDTTLDWSDAPFAKWFVGGELNVAYNCVDRHVEAGNGDRVAIHFVSANDDDDRAITYAEMQREVAKAANGLASLGVEKGDRVAIYMQMIPETIFTMLACARIGAPHSLVFAGFSADALRARIDDADAKIVVTSDGQFRKGKAMPLKKAVDDAVAGTSAKKVLVVKRTGIDVAWNDDRDVWWDDVVTPASDTHEAVAHDSEHPLFLLYTSGTTGKPKGILHTTGGYLVQCAYSNAVVHDLHPETDVYWCTADIGWVTGHSYIVYGPMANGATQIVFEGTPDSPHKGVFWEIVQKYGVSILYTAPTAIRTFMKWGHDIPEGYDLSSLRVLGSVGEPINPEAWRWYREHIGGGDTPIVDTWWQTETGAIMNSPLPGVTELEPGSSQAPIPGIHAEVLDDDGNKLTDPDAVGYLVLTKPWPAMLRGVWRDPQRYKDTYWSRFGPDLYFAGDGAKYDEKGNIWILGRVDDVMNVSGHRMSTAEIESALVSHDKVAEAAVVGATDPTTGQAIEAFVILRQDAADAADSADEGGELVTELRNHVATQIGPIAKPRSIMIVSELPKTRSGKIMRRLLKDVAENREVGDVTTLADSSVMSLIQDGMKSSGD